MTVESSRPIEAGQSPSSLPADSNTLRGSRLFRHKTMKSNDFYGISAALYPRRGRCFERDACPLDYLYKQSQLHQGAHR
jgi:hypothetical protein